MEVFVFAIVAFVLGGVIIMNRERLPERQRRVMAIAAIILIFAAFVMVVARFILMQG